MNNPRVRIVSLLLISSLLSDPVGAATLSALSSPPHQSVVLPSSLFTEQAIVTSLLSNRRLDRFITPVRTLWGELKTSRLVTNQVGGIYLRGVRRRNPDTRSILSYLNAHHLPSPPAPADLQKWWKLHQEPLSNAVGYRVRFHQVIYAILTIPKELWGLPWKIALQRSSRWDRAIQQRRLRDREQRVTKRLVSAITQTPKRLQFKNSEAMSRQAAEVVRQMLKKKADAVLLLPTGNTPLRMYELLVEMAQEGRIDFSRATIFMLDEYYDGTDYHDYIHKNLNEQLPQGARPRIHVLNGKVVDISRETRSYEHQIRTAGGIDLAILGVGAEGHIGFNEAGSPFDSPTRLVKLAESTLEANYPLMNSAEPYTHALTVGIQTILRAKKIIVLASGEKKAPAMAALFTRPPTTHWPITALQYHDDVTALMDDAAASLIHEPPLPAAGFIHLNALLVTAAVSGIATAALGGEQREWLKGIYVLASFILMGSGTAMLGYGVYAHEAAWAKTQLRHRRLRTEKRKALMIIGGGLFLISLGMLMVFYDNTPFQAWLSAVFLPRWRSEPRSTRRPFLQAA